MTVINGSGYPREGRADKDSYPHDGEKNIYWFDKQCFVGSK